MSMRRQWHGCRTLEHGVPGPATGRLWAGHRPATLADLAVPKIEGVVDGDVPGRRDDAINWRIKLCDLSTARPDLLSWHGLPAAVS